MRSFHHKLLSRNIAGTHGLNLGDENAGDVVAAPHLTNLRKIVQNLVEADKIILYMWQTKIFIT